MKLNSLILALLMTIGLFSHLSALKTSFPVYSENTNLKGQLLVYRNQFFQTENANMQDYLFNLIESSSDPAKNDIEADIALWDLKQADQYGKSHHVSLDMRISAVSNIGLTQNSKYLKVYWYILRFDPNVEIRKTAAASLGKIKNDLAVSVMVSLLNIKYNFAVFNESKQKMEEEDKVADALIKALGDNGSPKALPVLLQIVNMQNHRLVTIDSAWNSIEKLKMNSPASTEFLKSLRYLMKEKTDQVDYSQKGEVDKTVNTLVKFLQDNFEKYGFNSYDVETVKGTAPERDLDNEIFQYQ